MVGPCEGKAVDPIVSRCSNEHVCSCTQASRRTALTPMVLGTTVEGNASIEQLAHESAPVLQQNFISPFAILTLLTRHLLRLLSANSTWRWWGH